jgi:hypothetical protein
MKNNISHKGEYMSALSAHILSEVAAFRALTGMTGQSNTVHECLYASESIELLTATEQHKRADAFADMAVVMAGHYLDGTPFYDFEKAILGLVNQTVLNGIYLPASFSIVMESNFTKVCAEEFIQLTNEKYLAEGVGLTWLQTRGMWACFSAFDMPDKPKGKLLKPVTYKAPDWSGDSWLIRSAGV